MLTDANSCNILVVCMIVDLFDNDLRVSVVGSAVWWGVVEVNIPARHSSIDGTIKMRILTTVGGGICSGRELFDIINNNIIVAGRVATYQGNNC